MAIVELDLTGLNIDTVRWRGERLRARFGGGRGAYAVVGPTHGLHGWTLSAGVLPDNDQDEINNVSRFEYYYEFFKARTTGDEEVFIIEWRNRRWHAAFVEDNVSYETFTSDLYAGGVEIEQRTVEGYSYNADGSLFVPSDINGLMSWYRVSSDSSAVAMPDLSGNGRDLIGELPMPERTTNGGIPVFRWNGTNDNPFVGPDSYSVTHIFAVACAANAVFPASPAARGLFSGTTAGILAGVASDTKFFDMGYGANFAYKLNGTLYADNNAQAPMDGELGVIECKFPSTIGIDGLQIGYDRAFTGRIWEGDWAYWIAYNNASMTADEEYAIRQFVAAECGNITVIE